MVIIRFIVHSLDIRAGRPCARATASRKRRSDVNVAALSEYDLIGFGSGIAFGKHYKGLLKLVDGLPMDSKKAFVFSTRGAPRLGSYHRALKSQLEEKGVTIVGEFSCRGFDTYGAMKLIGRIARGRPNEQDLREAQEFAKSLEQS